MPSKLLHSRFAFLGSEIVSFCLTIFSVEDFANKRGIPSLG